ncbi:hypothetical protein [Rhodococcus sp. IEGM 1379]|uniref:hypothetical protein n=1 Tax=Rhodococcus sp. IEGM 1379 TaxID=3047086 RepID=UPI0024B8406E|nr:hypothetical protein [Rhodococcus sp. IEGM 1379]MDI9914388.1 hypothetical protein [Rhodococcus sp. IEGM 1379]
MRIRSTKPEFWRSSTIASVDWDARLVLKGLESYVDDNGVGKDDLALIVGDVFPRDMVANPRDTLARVTEAIGSLSEAGLLHRYKVDGKPLLYVSNWDSIQRIDKPGKGRLPRPDGTMDYKESVIRESVASPRESVAPGTGEQGNRGTEEKEDRPPVETETSLAAEPRKRGARAIAEHLNGTAHSPDAHTIARAYSDSCQTPIAGNTLAKIAQAIDSCLTSGINRTQIEVGIHDWAASPMTAPSTIPDFVHKAANRPTASAAANGVGKTTKKAMGWANLGNQLAQQQAEAISGTTTKGITA